MWMTAVLFGKTKWIHLIPLCYAASLEPIQAQALWLLHFSKIAARPTPSFAKTQITPSVNKDVSVFKVGQTIKHARYGEGTIVAISGENGDISFPVLGVKKFNLRLAPIEIVK